MSAPTADRTAGPHYGPPAPGGLAPSSLAPGRSAPGGLVAGPLENRPVGRSGLRLPAFSFGLRQRPGPDQSYASQREILLHAFDLGIIHFVPQHRTAGRHPSPPSASAYPYAPPFRAAQQTFGRVLREDLAAHRHELILATEAGHPIGPGTHARGGARRALLTSLEHSLRDLGTDYVDVFYHHRHDPATPLEETAAALAGAVRSGQARYIGISDYGPAPAARIGTLLRRAGVPLLIHQPRYSLFDRTPEQSGLIELSARDGFGLVIHSPLAEGLLTKKYLAASIPDGARAVAPADPGRRALGAPGAFRAPDPAEGTYRRRATALNRLAGSRGQSLAQLALQWVLRRREVTSALISASSTWQLEHNLRALEFPPLTPDELTAIDEHGVHGTGIRGV